MKLLNKKSLTEALRELPGWRVAPGENALGKTYELADFLSVIEFMNKAAPEIERLNHHPEWANVYNRLEVKLSTHSAGGVTELDIKLAMTLDKIYDTL